MMMLQNESKRKAICENFCNSKMTVRWLYEDSLSGIMVIMQQWVIITAPARYRVALIRTNNTATELSAKGGRY